ncbi:hypothetical protein F5Y01DRAFT_318879 [Xylaria sp. FL0043]|nr:hypothetical protein F5Y01DRAFT_318879 [Xylaria sp. FL0043]
MQFQLGLALIAASLAAAGPFTIRYHNKIGCTDRSLGCNRHNAYECCPQPPSPSSFPAVRVTSGGEFGIVNTPFNTVFVASITQCQAPALKQRNLDSFARVKAVEQHAECNGTGMIDHATVNGRVYDLTGPERMQVMNDVADMEDKDVFHAKWPHLYSGQDTLGTPTTLSTSTSTKTRTVVHS